MTINRHEKPNHLHNAGDVVIGMFFGQVCSVAPVNLPGATPYVRVSFVGGMALELSSETAIQLSRRLPEAIAALPVVPNVSGAVVDLGDAS